MTLEQIDNIQAGRELDAIVAEKVMGYTVTRVNGEPYTEWHGHKAEPYHLSHYSTDIAAAWEVVEKLRESGFTHLDLRFHAGRWGMVGYYNISSDDFRHTTWADTAPLAICRAALKAVASQQNIQLTELFMDSLTNRGKQTLANQAIEHLEQQDK